MSKVRHSSNRGGLLLVALGAVLAVGAYISHAQAHRILMAESAIAWPNQANISCFNISFGEIAQVCDISDPRTVDFMLPIDSTGSKTVHVTTDEEGGGMTCVAFALGPTGAGISGASVNMPSNLTTTPLGAVTVPSNGGLGASCNVTFNSDVRLLRWNE